MLSAPGAANAVLSVFKSRARAVFDPAHQRYDFPAALAALAPARSLLTDSASLAQFQQSLETEQQQQLASSAAQFERLLAARALLPDSSEPSLLSVREEIAKLDPAHPLLRDTRVAAAYRAAAAAALEHSDLEPRQRAVERWIVAGARRPRSARIAGQGPRGQLTPLTTGPQLTDYTDATGCTGFAARVLAEPNACRM